MAIQIIYNQVDKFQHLKNVFKKIIQWSISQLKLPIKTLNVIFTNDQHLQELHRDFFNLDSKTDVITFNLNEESDLIEGEIYISVERAEFHSQMYNVSSESELSRLIIHGCLHLAGYEDKTTKNRKIMKLKEVQMVHEVENSFLYNLPVKQT